MIYGIGVDIVEIGRIRRALDKHGDRFRDKIFTPAENAYCLARKKNYLHFALRFAAKEAFAKAVGLGMRSGITWKDIEIVNEDSGKPVLNLYGTSEDLCKSLGIRQKLVSLSHEEGYGVALVVLEA